MSIQLVTTDDKTVWRVLQCDTLGCETKPVAFPSGLSAEVCRDLAMFWFYAVAGDRDMCRDCWLIEGDAGAWEPLGILNVEPGGRLR